MRALLQRVKSASVVVDGKTVGSCGQGLLALIGIGKNDTQEDMDWIMSRMLGLKLWPNSADKPWKTK